MFYRRFGLFLVAFWPSVLIVAPAVFGVTFAFFFALDSRVRRCGTSRYLAVWPGFQCSALRPGFLCRRFCRERADGSAARRVGCPFGRARRHERARLFLAVVLPRRIGFFGKMESIFPKGRVHPRPGGRTSWFAQLRRWWRRLLHRSRRTLCTTACRRFQVRLRWLHRAVLRLSFLMRPLPSRALSKSWCNVSTFAVWSTTVIVLMVPCSAPAVSPGCELSFRPALPGVLQFGRQLRALDGWCLCVGSFGGCCVTGRSSGNM